MKFLMNFNEKTVKENGIVYKIYPDKSVELKVKLCPDGSEVFIYQLIKELDINTIIRIINQNKNKKIYFGYSEKNIENIRNKEYREIESFNYFSYEPVHSLDKMNYLIQLKVSIICLDGEICFDINEISKYLHGLHIGVCCNLNKYDCGGFQIKNNFGFFIRPEDLNIYFNLIDYGELSFENPEQEFILYGIYKNRKWNGNLQEIIYGLPEYLDSRTIYPTFGYERSKCRKRCSIGKCNLCKKVYDLSKIMIDKEIKFDK